MRKARGGKAYFEAMGRSDYSLGKPMAYSLTNDISLWAHTAYIRGYQLQRQWRKGKNNA